jgi:hypothetical protein
VWTFFPFGDRWLQAVQKHGKDAVDVATSRYYYTVDGNTERRSAFRNDSLEAELSFQNASGDNRSKGLAVFLHVTAGSDQIVIREQLRAVQTLASRRMEKVSLFFSVVGGDVRKWALVDYIQAFCLDERHGNITCIALSRYPVPYEGETLQPLHRFCQEYPDSIVSYVQSDLPPYMKHHIADPSHRFNLLVHLSRATLSPECIEALRRKGEGKSSCNTCGLIFYKLWTLFYPGNMFTASCTYVNDLLPPIRFEQQMEEYVKAALLARVMGYLRSGVFTGFTRRSLRDPYRADLLEVWGLDRFSVDFWLGSHPSLNPCDVSGDVAYSLSYWQGLAIAATDDGSDAFLGNGHYGPVVEAPTHAGSPLHFDQKRYNKALSDDSIRLREVSFLAGHLARWYHLYGSAPDLSSRLWTFFPDSEYWKNRVADIRGGVYNGSASDTNSLVWNFFRGNG